MRSNESHRPSLLIIDDDAAVCRSIARLLQDDFDVTTTTSPLEALTAIKLGEQFTCILCDLWMPDMNGPTFHRLLSEVSPEQAVRLVIVTGLSEGHDVRTFAAQHDLRVLGKPFTKVELLEVIERASAA